MMEAELFSETSVYTNGICQKALVFILAAVRTSNLAWYLYFPVYQ
jgi:hypothetical protein